MRTMNTSIYNFQKEFGNFLKNNAVELKNIGEVTQKIIIVLLDVFISGLGVIYMWKLGLELFILIISTPIIVVLLYLFFSVFFGLLSKFLETIGDWFVKNSKLARFSCKVIPQVEKYQKAEYIIEISNNEWFADAKDVKCSIGIGATVQDFEDRVIFDRFENNKKPRAIPYFLSGRWISEKENRVDIFRNKSKTMRFIKADILNNEIIVIGNSPDNDRPRDTSLPPRKYIFPISIYGKIKNGDFHAQFNIEVTYKGKDEISFAIMGNNFVAVDVVEKKSGEVPLWSISNS